MELVTARYDLSDFEWSVIEPVLPQVDDRQVLNGIFGVLRSGAPWADMLSRYGPTRLVATVAGDVQMIDGTSVRVHHSAATLKKATQIDVWVAAEAD